MTKTNVIYASKDTFISSSAPTLNFGTNLSLFTSHNSDKKQSHFSYIYFDLLSLPANAKIENASLELSLFRNDNIKPISLEIFKLVSPFDEYTTTFESIEQPYPLDEGDTPKLSVDPEVDITKPLVFINLTNTVSNWYNNPDSNFGFLIRPTFSPTSPIGFWSR